MRPDYADAHHEKQVPPASTRPVVALMMGDPTGIGPELCVKAWTDPAVRAACRPVVVGDARVMARALALVMYHDQGQIALKLLGFERGVTVGGGLPIVLATPAHGTAHDIAGRGVADVGAFRRAVEVASRLAAGRGAA